ncbi:MAG: hypothetical protein KI790_03470 [Cyclobacteriaceae bacterium]|nr:hypothetical protein [Cyclobacteriaceae bacterium HetDA_MAG_MS6]
MKKDFLLMFILRTRRKHTFQFFNIVLLLTLQFNAYTQDSRSCRELRNEEEKRAVYACPDGEDCSWCDRPRTPYTQCMCSREQETRALLEERDRLSEEWRRVQQRNREKRERQRALLGEALDLASAEDYDQRKYEQALSLMERAKSIAKTEEIFNDWQKIGSLSQTDQLKRKQGQIEYIEDQMSSLIPPKKEIKITPLSSPASSGSAVSDTNSSSSGNSSVEETNDGSSGSTGNARGSQSSETESTSSYDSEQARREERQRQEQAEAQRAEEQRQENYRRKQEYDRRIAEQRQRNSEIASASAASSASALALLGTIIYQGMGSVDPENLYFENQMYTGFDFGYSLTGMPMIFNTDKSTEDFNGGTQNIQETTNSYAFTVNFDLQWNVGFESEYAGGEGYAFGQAGFSPIFDAFNLGYGAGFRGYAGVSFAKIYADFGWGSRLFDKNNWIDPEDVGFGKLSYNYREMTLGARFTFNGSYRNTRHHLHLGFITERITSGDDTDEANYRVYFYDTQQISSPTGELSDYLIKGYSLEWQKEHHFKLYLNVFPGYPIAGVSQYSQSSDFREREQGDLFIEFGFLRQWKIFSPKRF